MIPVGKLGMVPLEKFYVQGPDASHLVTKLLFTTVMQIKTVA